MKIGLIFKNFSRRRERIGKKVFDARTNVDESQLKILLKID